MAIQFSRLYKIHISGRRLLLKHFSKTFVKISAMRSDLLPITYKCIRLQLQLLCDFMITDYNYNYNFPECNQLQLQLHCNVIDYNYNYFLVVPCLKKF